MLVSVVIPSYNHRQYVAQAIESVLNQSWPQIDLIVIDDGSKDGSDEAIRQMHDTRGGFRFVTRENQGLLATLNEGLSLAMGEYFCELASDDYFPVDSIERRIRYLSEHPECAAVFADGCLIEHDEPNDSSLIKDRHRKMFADNDPIPAMLKGALPIFSTGLIRCSALRAIGGFDARNLRYYEDLDTPILLSLQGKIGFIDEQVICRRHHETNISSTTSHVRLEKALCYRKLLGDDRMSSHKNITRKAYIRALLALGRHVNRNRGGTETEIAELCRGWRYVWCDLRLMWYFSRWARR